MNREIKIIIFILNKINWMNFLLNEKEKYFLIKKGLEKNEEEIKWKFPRFSIKSLNNVTSRHRKRGTKTQKRIRSEFNNKYEEG